VTTTADPTSSEIRSAARGSTLSLLGAAVSALGTFALTVVVAHGTTQVEAGVFFATTSLFVIVTSMGQLGTDTGLVYFIARAVEHDRRHLVQDYVRVALTPVLALATVTGLLLLVGAPEIARLTNPTATGEATHALRALALLVPFVGLESVLLSATRGLGLMRPYVVVEQILRPTLQLVVAVLILATGTMVDLAWSWSLPYLVAGLLAVRWWRRLVPRRTTSWATLARTPGVGREFWSFSAPRSLASAAQTAMQRLDIVLVAALAGPGPAAIYTAATRFVVAGQLARTAVSLAVQPYFARALAREGGDHVAPLYRTSTAWLMAVTWPLFWVLVLDGRPLMGVFGSGYATGTDVLVLLGVAMLVATFCGDVDVLLIMAGRTRASMVNILTAFALNLGLDLWLIPEHGIVGAAIGWACAIIVKNLLALVQVAWILRVHPVGRPTVIVAALATGCFGGCVGLARLLLGDGLGVATAGILVGAVLYATGLFLARTDLALDALGGLVRRTPRVAEAPPVYGG
jgi:O-antigen/teichoic acid export membrane protein